MVVLSGQCLVHVVGSSGQGTGKCKPGLWNSGSGALGEWKKEADHLGTFRWKGTPILQMGRLRLRWPKMFIYLTFNAAQAVGQALGSLHCLHGADILVRVTYHKYNT